MKSALLLFFLTIAKLSLAQGPGPFSAFLGPKNYELGSNRVASDTNIYLQENGIIHENGRTQHIYHYKNLHQSPYTLGGILFTDLLLFYESNKLTRIDIAKTYADSTEMLNADLHQAELQQIASFIRQQSGKKGKKRAITKGRFYQETGYQWKAGKTLMQAKLYQGNVPRPNHLLILSIRYTWY